MRRWQYNYSIKLLRLQPVPRGRVRRALGQLPAASDTAWNSARPRLRAVGASEFKDVSATAVLKNPARVDRSDRHWGGSYGGY